MTKTEFLKQGVGELRDALKGMFEDPEGEFDQMTKKPLVEFAKENWDEIEDRLSEPEAAEDVVEEEADAEVPLDQAPEPIVEESPPTPERSDGSATNPKTNLA